MQRLSKMSSVMLAAGAAATAIAAGPAKEPVATAPEAPAGYRLVWGDEFNADGALNPADWSFEHGVVRNHANPFRQPHYILLNLAIGGDNGGTPDLDAFPLRYEIDYVRIYEKVK